MAQEIDINLNVNAQQADKSLGSLKSQLREAQAEVQTLSDKFGATSTQAIEAARAAAVLKDKIGDAKNLTDAFNPDAKFKALSASIGGVASGFAAYQGALGLAGVESKKLQEQLLQVQSAMALAQGLQGLGEARDSFKQLGAVAKSVFAGIKNAIGATGIGLLVVALGAIYAYWDDIKEAVNGVSSEQKRLNQLAEKNVQIANENLKSAKSMDSTLKLQGKSEKEILDIKIKATQASIDANISRVKGLQLTNKIEAEAAQRNYERLKSFIDFVSIPQRILFETAATAINKIIDLANKIPGIEIKGKIDEKFAEKATDYITKLAFDPEKTKAEGAATLKATQDAIKDLTNERDGYILTKNKQDTKASKDSKKDIEDAFKEEQKLIEEKLKNDKISIDEKRNIVLEDNKLSKEDKTKFLLELHDKEIQLEVEKNEKLAKLEQDKIAKEDAQWLRMQELTLEKSEYEALVRQQNFEKEYIAAEGNAELQLALKKAYIDKETEIDNTKSAADIEREKNRSEAIGNFKQNLSSLTSSLEATGLAKSKAGQAIAKTIALTQLGIDTAVAISNAGTLATAEGAKAALAFGPGAGTIARIISYASSYGQVISNFMKAKTMLSSGGGGGAAGAGGGGGGAAASPSFNIVGPSGANQIAESIGNKESQPLKAFVVGGDVTSQQSLNRGIVQNATLG